MKYRQLQEGTFLKRPNRFIAHVMIDDQEVICHVKNTGRLRELLIPGTKVLIEPADNPNRKTKFSLIAVLYHGYWVNIDSQVVNEIAAEWIKKGKFLTDVALVKREKTYGDSRFDLYIETTEEKWYIEVKGVTLEIEGQAWFPDAPTERGVKHVRELMGCIQNGYRAGILFVIQRKGIQSFSPNEERHPEFAVALREAADAGVEIMAVDCLVDEYGIEIDQKINVVL